MDVAPDAAIRVCDRCNATGPATARGHPVHHPHDREVNRTSPHPSAWGRSRTTHDMARRVMLLRGTSAVRAQGRALLSVIP
jgi:hypothetical protein